MYTVSSAHTGSLQMDEKQRQRFTLSLAALFLIGTTLLMIEFITAHKPNRTVFSAFLIILLVLALFHDKIKAFGVSKEGFIFLLNGALDKANPPNYISTNSYGGTGETLKTQYDPRPFQKGEDE